MAFSRAVRQGDLRARVTHAQSLASAGRALEEAAFDCVVLDYQLPDGNAMDLLRRQDDLLALPPIVILTGFGSESVAVELMKAGAYDYVPKDELTPSRIAQSVRNALRVRRGEDALRHAYDELEERVHERTAALAQTNRELEQEMVDRRRAEDQAREHLEQLAHVSRMSTLGEMAASLAHELNQPLGAVSNYASGLLRRMESGTADEEVLTRALEKIAAQALRAGNIIQRLRRFVRAREPQREEVEVEVLLREVADLENVEARYNGARIEFEFVEGLARVFVDVIQVQQVALNLLRNGLEAMAAVGEDERLLTVSAEADGGDGVRVTIADRGPGCPGDELERIFEPFVSTKESGMGLGLAISRSIIEAQGGRLWAEPRAGGGLAVRFTLPGRERWEERER